MKYWALWSVSRKHGKRSKANCPPLCRGSLRTLKKCDFLVLIGFDGVQTNFHPFFGGFISHDFSRYVTLNRRWPHNDHLNSHKGPLRGGTSYPICMDPTELITRIWLFRSSPRWSAASHLWAKPWARRRCWNQPDVLCPDVSWICVWRCISVAQCYWTPRINCHSSFVQG